MDQNQNALVQMLTELLESEPAYIIGRQLIQRLAAETGIGEEQAAEALLYAAPGGKEALCACAAQDLARLRLRRAGSGPPQLAGGGRGGRCGGLFGG